MPHVASICWEDKLEDQFKPRHSVLTEAAYAEVGGAVILTRLRCDDETVIVLY